MAGSSDLVNNVIFLTITGRAAGKEIHMPYTEKKIIIGDIMEVMRYHSTKGGSVQRGEKEKASTPAQKKANEIRTGNELWRVIYINFDGQQGDQFNTFTFAEDIGEEEARKEWRNFTRRVRRYLKKNGLPDLKYVYTLEKQGRWHIHAVMNGIPLKDLTKLWGRGRVSSSILDKTNDYRDLAAWLSLEDITNKETFDLAQFRGCYAIGGADLSSSRDLTCATLLLIDRETEKRFVTQMYWIPEDSLERRVNEEKLPYDKWHERGLVRLCKGNTINYKDVTAWFVEMANTYGIFPAWIYYDRWSATYWVEEMKATGFTEMKGVAQGAKTLSLPMQFLGADLQAKRINYNNNPVLRWCLSNTGVQEDRNGNIVPIKNQAAKQRIDGTASLLNAYVGLYEHYNEFIEAQ